MKKFFMKASAVLGGVMMLFAVSCHHGSDGGSDGGKDTTPTGDNGTVSVVVTVDGTIKCGTCGKEYDLMEAAKACEHYKCDTCGTPYASEEEKAACVKHFKFTFKDSAETDANEDVVVTIPSGAKVKLPEWSKDGEEIAWDTDSDYRNDGENLDLSKPMVIADDSEDTLIEITLTASWKTTYTCSTCSKIYYTEGEAASCNHYICANEACERHTSGYATQTEADNCALKDGCPKYETECSVCHKKYAHDADAVNCADTVNCPKAVTVTVTFKDSAAASPKADVTKKIFSGSSAESAAPEWTLENYKLSWSPAFAAITADTTYTANWTELPKCDKCGTHYETQDKADNCGKQEGCPQFGKDLDWISGDTSLPSWLLGISGSATSDNKKKPYASNGYEKFNKIAKNTAITVTPIKTGKISVYIVANKDSSDAARTCSAKMGETLIGSAYQLPAYNATTLSPMVITVTADMVGKPVVLSTTYEALWYAIILE